MQGGGPRVVVSTAAFHARVRGSVPGLGGLKVTKLFLPHPRVKDSILGSLRDREVACSASDRQGSNFKSCVWRTVSQGGRNVLNWDNSSRRRGRNVLKMGAKRLGGRNVYGAKCPGAQDKYHQNVLRSRSVY